MWSNDRDRPVRLGVESLETRAVPAGNVTASVSGGVMSVIGDPADNQVSVQQNSAGDLFVFGLNGTTVNGLPGVYLGRGTPSAVLIDLGRGSDYVEVVGLVAGRIVAQGGEGSDTIWMVNSFSFGNVEAYGSGDNDSVFMSGVVAQGLLALDGGAGSDAVHVDNSVGFQGAFAINFEGSF